MKNERGLVGNFVNIDRKRTARSQELTTKLSYRILSLCEEHGLSQHQLAIQAGLDPNYISRIIRGKTESGLVTLEALAHVFGVTLSEFFEGVTPVSYTHLEHHERCCSRGIQDGAFSTRDKSWSLADAPGDTCTLTGCELIHNKPKHESETKSCHVKKAAEGNRAASKLSLAA